MDTQARKHTLGLSGEFFVAAELLRRGLMASVTYGNAKKADVIALSRTGRAAVVLEVKSTSQDSWVVGGYIPKPSDNLWVFVYVPKIDGEAPKYFVLTSQELNDILSPIAVAYRARYKSRHNREYTGTGVETLTRKQAQPFEGKWDKIVSRINGD